MPMTNGITRCRTSDTHADWRRTRLIWAFNASGDTSRSLRLSFSSTFEQACTSHADSSGYTANATRLILLKCLPSSLSSVHFFVSLSAAQHGFWIPSSNAEGAESSSITCDKTTMGWSYVPSYMQLTAPGLASRFKPSTRHDWFKLGPIPYPP